MIRKLRIRLILISMVAVFLVLVVMIGGINVSNYRQVVSESDTILEILMENGGVFDESRYGFPEGFDPTNPDFDPAEFYEEGRASRRSGPRFPVIFDEDRLDSPELAKETRYFSVLLDKDGDAILPDISHISAISERTAGRYAAQAFRSGKSSGFIQDYRYLIGEEDASGNRLVIFRDCGASLANFRNFRNISIFASLLCLTAVFILVFLASERIVRPVAESYEKQKRFITDAGHEIKTPLAIISADADVLEMDLEEGNEWLSDIRMQTKRLSELTQDLILLSKMEESTTVLEMTDLDLTSLSKAQAGSFDAVAIASGKTIKTNIEENVHIQGDKKSIESLLSIVLDNAVKYCPENGTIEFSVSRSKKDALIEVTNDTEETLSEETCKSMFERFYRADQSRNSGTGGHGIGLSIARAIAEKHKGRISAASPSEKKLTVSINL